MSFAHFLFSLYIVFLFLLESVKRLAITTACELTL